MNAEGTDCGDSWTVSLTTATIGQKIPSSRDDDLVALGELEVPPVPVLLAKISRQTTRINSLEHEVELLRKQLEERDLERSMVEEAAEQVLRELAIVPIEGPDDLATDPGQSFASEESAGTDQQENDAIQPQTNLDAESPLAAKKYRGSFSKGTYSSVEYKYQVLLKRHEAQSREVASIHAELEHVKRSKRRANWERWEGDLAKEKIQRLEEYAMMLERSQFHQDSDVTQLLVREINRGRSEAKELRDALCEIRTELHMTKSKASRTDSVLKDIASMINIEGPAYLGREEVLVAGVENAQRRAVYSQNLAVKAKTLLTVAIEERDRLEEIFRTARKENSRFGSTSRLVAIIERMDRYQTLARAYPELLACLKGIHAELQGMEETRMVLEKERRKCRKIITQALEKSSEILDIPLSSRRTNFDLLSEGVTLLARLTLSQLHPTPVKSSSPSARLDQ